MSSIEKDERLLPLPNVGELNLTSSPDAPTAYAPFYDDESFSEGRSLREYFLIIYKKLPLILALTILVTAVVSFYMYRMPTVYEATTVMVIEPRKPKATQGNNFYINYGEDTNYYNTQLRLLRSPDLMKDVVLDLGLYNNPALFGDANKGFVSSVRSMVSGDKSTENKDALPVITDSKNTTDVAALLPEQKARAESYAAILGGSLTVDQQPSSQLVTVKVTSTNPDIAPRVANRVAELFIKQDTIRANKGAADTLAELTASIETLKTNIAQQEQQRLNQMQVANLPLTEEKGNDFNALKLQTLSTQYLTAEDDRRKIQAQYEAASAASKRGEILSVTGPTGFIADARKNQMELSNQLQKRIDDIDKQISEAESKKQQLLVRYQPEYQEVKIAEAQLKNLREEKTRIETDVKQKVEGESKKMETSAEREVLTGLQAQLAAAQGRETALKAAYFKEIGISSQQAQSQTRLTTLTNEIETNRNLLKTYTQRQKEMELNISSNTPENIAIANVAGGAGPVGPQRSRNIIIAFLLSLGLGVGLAFLMDYLDDSIKSSDDIGKHLGLPTLALIPHESILGRRKGVTDLLDRGGNASSTALVAIENNRSPLAEAYRHLRTSLLFSSAGKPPQTVLVTSSQPSEGKTTTAINTAITLAQAGAEVVIIDCDLRRPRLHNHFGMDNSTGLTNYLSGERNLDKLLKTYPQMTKVKVITSGPIPPNPAELLSSNEMKNLLTSLKGRFNHIIVDSPPAISFTDAAVLSTLVDGVIMVAMAGKSSIQLIRRFKQRLNSVGTRIYGVVLNGIRPDSFEYGYYGYGYEYSYYSDNDDSTPKMKDAPKVETSEN